MLVSPLPPPAGGISTWTSSILQSELSDTFNIVIVNSRLRGARRIFEPAKISFSEVYRSVSIIALLFFRLLIPRIAIVHLSSSLSRSGIIRDLICALMVKARAVPLVVHYHGNVSAIKRGGFCSWPYHVLRWLHALADINVVLSEESAAASERFVPQEKIRIVPNFLTNSELALREGSRSRPKTEENKITVIYVGGLAKQKGLLEIVAIASGLPEIDFKLIGHDTAESKDILRGCTENVSIIGSKSRQEVFGYLSEGDIFLFPSHGEGFPMAVLEAMAVGLPVVATDVGAIPEVVENNRGGFVGKVGDVEGLRAAVEELVVKKYLRIEFGKFNREKVEKYYREEIVIRMLLEIYKSLLDKPL